MNMEEVGKLYGEGIKIERRKYAHNVRGEYRIHTVVKRKYVNRMHVVYRQYAQSIECVL